MDDHDPNKLLRQAALWFRDAILAHVRAYPDQCDGWLQDFESGLAGATVTVRITPNQEILCGFEIGEKVIVFHRTPLTQTGQSAVPH